MIGFFTQLKRNTLNMQQNKCYYKNSRDAVFLLLKKARSWVAIRAIRPIVMLRLEKHSQGIVFFCIKFFSFLSHIRYEYSVPRRYVFEIFFFFFLLLLHKRFFLVFNGVWYKLEFRENIYISTMRFFSFSFSYTYMLLDLLLRLIPSIWFLSIWLFVRGKACWIC